MILDLFQDQAVLDAFQATDWYKGIQEERNEEAKYYVPVYERAKQNNEYARPVHIAHVPYTYRGEIFDIYADYVLYYENLRVIVDVIILHKGERIATPTQTDDVDQKTFNSWMDVMVPAFQNLSDYSDEAVAKCIKGKVQTLINKAINKYLAAA